MDNDNLNYSSQDEISPFKNPLILNNINESYFICVDMESFLSHKNSILSFLSSISCIIKSLYININEIMRIY
jgi:hypothetical protein